MCECGGHSMCHSAVVRCVRWEHSQPSGVVVSVCDQVHYHHIIFVSSSRSSSDSNGSNHPQPPRTQRDHHSRQELRASGEPQGHWTRQHLNLAT
jgi:hypothetical protein